LRLAMPNILPSIENSSLYFGEWGNSEFNNTNDWIQVLWVADLSFLDLPGVAACGAP
jgi:hypothetical protein